MTESIASTLNTTLKSFNSFIEQINNRTVPYVDGFSRRRWKDELGRLRIWAANIGAHQTNQFSLDFRLCDASHIKEQIVKLLKSLLRRLDDERNVLTDGEDVDLDLISDEASQEGVPKLEMKQMQESVATITGCLFQMSMLVRKPANHGLRMGSKWSEFAPFEFYDSRHVREKYPKANETLVSRLGKAITQRRMYLAYRERHAAKLRQGLTSATEKMSVLSETVATSPEVPNVDFPGASQTSHAPTLMGHGNLSVPHPPKDSLGDEPFECPFCYHIIAISTTQSWTRHVFQDLQPYVCMKMDCTKPQKLYTTKHEWRHHLKTRHRETANRHATSSEASALCPLCQAQGDNEDHLASHIARHLQDLALFVLPRDDDNSDEDLSGTEPLLQSTKIGEDDETPREDEDSDEKYSDIEASNKNARKKKDNEEKTGEGTPPEVIGPRIITDPRHFPEDPRTKWYCGHGPMHNDLMDSCVWCFRRRDALAYTNKISKPL